LITDEWRMFEQKGIDAKRVKNYLRLIMLSNLPHAAPAMPGDRRYTVIDMQQRKATQSLIDKVLYEKDNGGPAALFRYLMEFDYDPLLARRNVKSSSLIEMKTHNLNPVEAWWMEILSSGTLLPDRLNWAQKPTKDHWPEVIGSPALYAAMETSLRSRNIRTIPHQVSFNILMEKMLGRKVNKSQREYSNELVGEIGVPQAWTLLGNRQLSWIDFPRLEDCRKSFDRHIGQNVTWPEQAEYVGGDDNEDRPQY
jgi:hypothetical protein